MGLERPVRRAAVAVFASTVAAFGCLGDDEVLPQPEPAPVCVDTAVPSPDGVASSPAELVRDDCVAGALAELDPSGQWLINDPEPTSPFSASHIRFDLDCESGLSFAGGSFFGIPDQVHISLDEDDLFWRAVFDFGEGVQFVDASTACAVDTSGALRGSTVSCFVDGDKDNCFESAIVLTRFGRAPGELESEGLELVSEFAGTGDAWPSAFTANVRVRDGVAYVARSTDGLRIVDVSDPNAPADLGHLAVEEEDYNDLKVVAAAGSVYVLAASDRSGVDVIDVTDPANPALVGFFAPNGDPLNGVHTLFTETIASTTLAYLADGGSSFMEIYDVTDPLNPVSVGGYTAPDPNWAFHDLYVEGGRVFINATVGGFLVVDTQPDPTTPVLVGQFLPEDPLLYSHSSWVTTAGGRTIAVHGDEGFDAHVKIVDVDDASGEFLQVIGEFQTRAEVSAHNIQAFGERAYIAHYQDGVRILDLSDPTSPQQTAYFNTWSPARSGVSFFEGAVGIDVDTASGLLYVADTPRGLMILRETQ